MSIDDKFYETISELIKSVTVLGECLVSIQKQREALNPISKCQDTKCSICRDHDLPDEYAQQDAEAIGAHVDGID